MNVNWVVFDRCLQSLWNVRWPKCWGCLNLNSVRAWKTPGKDCPKALCRDIVRFWAVLQLGQEYNLKDKNTVSIYKEQASLCLTEPCIHRSLNTLSVLYSHLWVRMVTLSITDISLKELLFLILNAYNNKLPPSAFFLKRINANVLFSQNWPKPQGGSSVVMAFMHVTRGNLFYYYFFIWLFYGCRKILSFIKKKKSCKIWL